MSIYDLNRSNRGILSYIKPYQKIFKGIENLHFQRQTSEIFFI